MANVATPTQLLSSPADHTDEEKKVVERVRKDQQYAARARAPYETRWDEWYALHRNVSRYTEAARAATSEPDRDEIVNAAKREFGAELFIPYVYAVIESTLPRLLMNNPRMKIKPRHKTLERERSEAVRLMFEERQREVDYALKLIPVARSGLMYGLGVTKNFWDRKEKSRLALETRDFRARVVGPYVKPQLDVNEGPMVEDVDVLNFFWDPAAKDVETARFLIHRTWRDLSYIRERVERKEWAPVDLEAVKKMSPDMSRDDVFRNRQAAAGLDETLATGADTGQRMHEVWEWHNGEEMATILDGQLLVQAGKFDHKPFSIFRPTHVQTEFVGRGEIEPIVSLQHELNALRSMRLDNAMLVMQKAFIYAEGLVDPADLVVGPGVGIPVEGGAIGDVIQPLNFGELPAASYQETSEIKADIGLASALDETITAGAGNQGGAPETATEVQFTQAAASARVELKTKMLVHELVASDARQWLDMFRERTLMQPREVAVESPTEGYDWIAVTGQDLDLVETVLPEDDSMAPENLPQKRNDALALNNQLTGSQVIDERKRMRWLLDAFDVSDADAWILPEQTMMNPQVAQVVGETLQATLKEAGMDDEQADEIALAAMERAMQAAGLSQPVGEPSDDGSSIPQPQEA